MAQTQKAKERSSVHNVWCFIRDGFLMVGYYTLTVLKYIIITPFFILSTLKNWFFMGISTTIAYFILSMAYHVFTNNPNFDVTDFDKINSILFTDIRCWILVIVSGIFALILTIGQYRGEID
ncbi:hypothetical protein V2H32_10150 [Streptococcus uberis]|nr:hypothetical protein [Streptococcus agalactiae]MCH9591288.1 hypothetical protein [Streptococcus agalactiae]MEE3699351.1 hypothetical protein [Streptococcus uberis]